MQSVGINIGSSSLKVACVADGKLLWAESIPHEGNFHIAAVKFRLLLLPLGPDKIHGMTSHRTQWSSLRRQTVLYHSLLSIAI